MIILTFIMQQSYIEADYKTESKQYVSTLNCGVTSAYEEMKITKEQWNKKE